MDELPAATVDTQQRIQGSRGGTSSCCCQKMNLTSSTPLWENCLCFFSPSPRRLSFFLAPLARLVFGLMGIILSKRPTVMSEAEHLAFFCQVSIFPVSPTWLCTVTVDLAKRCAVLSRPKGFRGSACKSAAVPTGFQLKETADVRLTEVLTGAKISASGSLTLEVPESGFSNLLGFFRFALAQVSGKSPQC